MFQPRFSYSKFTQSEWNEYLTDEKEKTTIEMSVLLFAGRYFRYRKYRMKVYRVQIWAIFMRSIAQIRYSSHTCEL